jgi:cell division transport system ATP-binding protein
MIRLHGIAKTFSAGRHALRGVDLQVAEGEFAVLTGPSGSGKSTLLRILIGEVVPCRGRAVVLGRNLSRLDRPGLAELRRELGLVFDDPRLLVRRTALENVALAAEVAGEPRVEAERLALRALESVGIAELAHCRPSALSKGQGQLVSLARALVNSPSLVLADEPLLHLDTEHAHRILDTLSRECRRGATVVMASHNLALLSSLRCRVLMMAGGRLLEETSLRASAAL